MSSGTTEKVQRGLRPRSVAERAAGYLSFLGRLIKPSHIKRSAGINERDAAFFDSRPPTSSCVDSRTKPSRRTPRQAHANLDDTSRELSFRVMLPLLGVRYDVCVAKYWFLIECSDSLSSSFTQCGGN